jgi:biopolymer transport protein ExbB
MESIKYFFEVGGWAMYGIAICSIVALAIFLERLWSLRNSQVTPRALYIDVEAMIEQNKIAEAAIFCKKNASSLAKLLYEGLSQWKEGKALVNQRVSEETERQAYELERGVGVLAMIMTLAPLLGFLGTVLGMVELFSSIAQQGEVQNLGVIAGGVYKALYTTVAGLTVAIPATLFHKYCLSLVDRHLLRLEELSTRLFGQIKI